MPLRNLPVAGMEGNSRGQQTSESSLMTLQQAGPIRPVPPEMATKISLEHPCIIVRGKKHGSVGIFWANPDGINVPINKNPNRIAMVCVDIVLKANQNFFLGVLMFLFLKCLTILWIV